MENKEFKVILIGCRDHGRSALTQAIINVFKHDKILVHTISKIDEEDFKELKDLRKAMKLDPIIFKPRMKF